MIAASSSGVGRMIRGLFRSTIPVVLLRVIPGGFPAAGLPKADHPEPDAPAGEDQDMNLVVDEAVRNLPDLAIVASVVDLDKLVVQVQTPHGSEGNAVLSQICRRLRGIPLKREHPVCGNPVEICSLRRLWDETETISGGPNDPFANVIAACGSATGVRRLRGPVRGGLWGDC